MGEDVKMRITVFGTRGSVPVSGENTLEFGGNTSCYLFEADGASLVVDAGTGIRNIPPEAVPTDPVTVVLTHPHADHLAGLPFFAPILEAGRRVDLYAVPRGGAGCREQTDRYFSPPLWPIRLSEYPAEVGFYDLSFPLSVGPFFIEGIEGNHPGGSTVLKISCGGRVAVLATDFEHSAKATAALVPFSRGADLLMYDAQYTDEEFEIRRGYGHSTARAGLEIMRECGAKKLLLIHHDPDADDARLLREESTLGTDAARYAREGEVIGL